MTRTRPSSAGPSNRTTRTAHAGAHGVSPESGTNGTLAHGAPTPAHQSRPVRAATTPLQDPADSSSHVKSVAADAAHDMAALLFAIDSNLDLLDAEWLSKEGANSVRSLRTVNSYLRGLTRELRGAGAGSVTGPRRETSLAIWWPDMGELLQALHGDNLVVRADIPPDLPGVCIKPQHLTQVVLNLVANAAHASAESRPVGFIHGGLPVESQGAQVEILARAAEDGRSVSLTIADNGPGMTATVLARAGEPSFTTRADRGGTGLGLAMVQRLVGAAGGSVRFSSVVGAGTTVTINLPTGVGDQ
jgi:signal transduction histidine kinase